MPPPPLRTALALAAWAFVAAPLSGQVLVPPIPGGQFGKAVALAGDLLVIGAPRAASSGVAYVFRKGGGRFTLEAALSPAGAVPGLAFAQSVATDGERVLVGAPWEAPQAGQLGSAHLFEWDGSTWREALVFTADQPEDFDGFGHAVGLSQDLAVVAAPRSDRVALDGGIVHTFRIFAAQGAPTSAVHAGTFAAPDVGLSDGFGWSLAMGRTVASGAPLLAIGAVRDDDGNVNAGACHVAVWQGNAWQRDGKLVAPSATPNAFLGTSVALDGDTIVAGAPGANEGGPGAGAAWVFERIAGNWTAVARLLDPSPAPGDAFGISVGVAGEVLLVGASHADSLGLDSGAAHLFRQSGGTSTHVRELTPWVGAAGDYFGLALAVEGEFTAVGAFGDDRAGNLAGSVHLYDTPGLAAPWVTPFCFCPTGAACGNLDLDAGCNNSTGRGASFEWWGSPSIAAGDLHLVVRDLPPGSAAIVFLGDGTGSVFLTDGRICVGAGSRGVFRTSPMAVGQDGTLVVATDLAGRTQSVLAGVGGLSPGETWHYQAWYRDLASLCGSGANASSALSVVFAP